MSRFILLLLFPLFLRGEETLAIIKPEIVASKKVGNVISCYESEGLNLKKMKIVHLSKEQAGEFYAVHKDRPFFDALTTYISEGPIVVIVLEGDKTVARNRQLMGATNPKEALPGTIRFRYAKDLQRNAVHGSDSAENAKKRDRLFLLRSFFP